MTATDSYRSLHTRTLRCVLCVCVFGLSLTTAVAVGQEIKSFPQAEGFGAEATGGRGGVVYHVTSLGDTNTPGTLRYGLNTFSPSTPVTIVFDVGGWINLNENLGITRSNITIAGQTAPGGIGIRNRKFSIGGDDIIVRHVQFAHGRTAAAANDTVNVNNNSTDVIFDHVAAVLARDENFSAQSTNLTLQWSTVSYGLQTHSAGSLLEQPTNLSFHHNVWAHNHTRNPKARVQGAFDFINNIVYDYNIGFIAGDSGTTDYFWPNNFDGNYFITGPGDVNTPMIVEGHEVNTGLYFGTNAYDGDGDAQHDGVVYQLGDRGLSNLVRGTFDIQQSPYPVADPIWQEADTEATYQRVLAEFGPNPHARNDLMQYIADNVTNRTGTLISDQDQLTISDNGWGAITGGAAPADGDGDGIPDDWEEKHGTDPSRATNNLDFDADGFTDLEEYLNDLAAFKATGPLEFDGTGRYAEWQNWTRRWEPSRVDDVHINTGAAVVDAVGQKAGTLVVGADGVGGATLQVDSGWLEVTDDLRIAAPNSTVQQNGGTVRVLAGGVTVEDGEYRLSGGSLHTPTLNKSGAGQFVLEGGELHAEMVGFDLTNSGGVISPGESIGQTTITGDMTISAGALLIELAGDQSADQLMVTGAATLGGVLDVQMIEGYEPSSGEWEILTAASISGAFTSVTEGFTVVQEGGSLFLVLNPPTLPGDFNGDGVVDILDLDILSGNFGASGGALPSEGDANGDGNVDILDLDILSGNFGATAEGSSAVPEPNSAVSLLIFSFLGAPHLATFRRSQGRLVSIQ